MLELGPGDSIASGLLAHAFGARHTYLIDTAPYVHRDIMRYRRMMEKWASAGVPMDDLLACDSFEALCARAHITYLTSGLTALQALPSGSIDFAFSNAVLEHLPRVELLETMIQLRRVLKDDGRSYHQVDLKDHLGGALHSLRFPDRLWEAPWFARSGFYTNRLRYGELLGRLTEAGFDFQVTAIWRWSALPTSRSRMRPRFRAWPEEDLLVAGFDVVLRPVVRRG